MALLIDGYNLLHVTGIFGRGMGPGTLERSRRALLNFLAESLTEEEAARTTVVFDAQNPPPGLPPQVTHRGINVLYASQYENADELLEEVIEADSAPRQLVVVSSDHRLHRAARRRKAQAVDSDQWYAGIVRRRQERQQASPPAATKPEGPLTEGEVEFWLAVFGE
jgi:predicted RNA-binding protein with PIN domain